MAGGVVGPQGAGDRHRAWGFAAYMRIQTLGKTQVSVRLSIATLATLLFVWLSDFKRLCTRTIQHRRLSRPQAWPSACVRVCDPRARRLVPLRGVLQPPVARAGSLTGCLVAYLPPDAAVWPSGATGSGKGAARALGSAS